MRWIETVSTAEATGQLTTHSRSFTSWAWVKAVGGLMAHVMAHAQQRETPLRGTHVAPETTRPCRAMRHDCQCRSEHARR